jgi:ribonuclease HI
MTSTQITHIYTDGSCIGNPGPGGWAFCIIRPGDTEWCLSVSDSNPLTTNNRMEMMAVIRALEYIKETLCTIFTDSKLVMNCAQNIWKRKANKDLWNRYDTASKEKKINWVWIKAHNGNKYNEIVDKMALQEARNQKI